MNLSDYTPLELLALSARIHRRLLELEVVRSQNKPTGDYAEYLVAKALGLKLVEKSNKGYDAFDPKTGKRYEIKARRSVKEKAPGNFSVLRNLKTQHFDRITLVVFDEEYKVLQAAVLPYAVLEDLATYRKHVNGWILPVSEKVMTHPKAKDISEEMPLAQES